MFGDPRILFLREQVIFLLHEKMYKNRILLHGIKFKVFVYKIRYWKCIGFIGLYLIANKHIFRPKFDL